MLMLKSEVYLEHCQTSVMEIFCVNSKRLKADIVLNTCLKVIGINMLKVPLWKCQHIVCNLTAFFCKFKGSNYCFYRLLDAC